MINKAYKHIYNTYILILIIFQKLIDSVILTDDAQKLIDVRYFSKCFNGNSILKERQECDGVRVDNVAQFEIILKVSDDKKFIKSNDVFNIFFL